MKKFVAKNYVWLFFTWLIIMLTIQSRWIVGWLKPPSSILKVAALLTYVPFAVFALQKLISDIKTRKKDLFTILYYGFAAYYVGISIYRLFTHGELKDSLYYTIILFGTLSLFSIVFQQKNPEAIRQLTNCACIFQFILLVYRLLFLLFVEKIIKQSPVNEIAMGTALLLLLPISFEQLRNRDYSMPGCIFYGLLISGTVLVFLSLGSRAVFFLLLVELIPLVLTCIKCKRAIFTGLIAIVCALAMLCLLFVCDAGRVRYNVYRQTGIDFSVLLPVAPSSPSTSTDSETSNQSNSSEQSEEQKIALSQIQRSDAMRKTLSKRSLKEFRKNPWIGTGTALFPHRYNQGRQIIHAPAHNIFLQTLNCYGIIGLILLIALILTLIIKTRLFRLKEGRSIDRIYLFTVLILYFGISLIQATAYDVLVMPTAFICMAVLAASIQPNNQENHGK